MAEKYDNRAGNRRAKAVGRSMTALSFILLFMLLLSPVSHICASDGTGSGAVSGGAVTEDPEATPEPEGGGFFITKTHIIISCVVAFGIAVVIAVVQANKRFK